MIQADLILIKHVVVKELKKKRTPPHTKLINTFPKRHFQLIKVCKRTVLLVPHESAEKEKWAKRSLLKTGLQDRSFKVS